MKYEKGVQKPILEKYWNEAETVLLTGDEMVLKLNPQEHIWKEGRKATTHNVFVKDIEEVATALQSYLQSHRFPYTLLGFCPPF